MNQEQQYFFDRSTTDSAGCWIWDLSKNKLGYGWVRFRGKVMQAHRASYFAFNEDLSSSKEFVCHSCDNPSCVNPEHLWVGTAWDNIKDMTSKRRNRRGESHHKSVLSENSVVEIKLRLLVGESTKSISSLFGVTPGTIHSIKIGKSWKHITLEEVI